MEGRDIKINYYLFLLMIVTLRKGADSSITISNALYGG